MPITIAQLLGGNIDATDNGQRKNLLHRNAGHGHSTRRGLLQKRFGWNIRRRGDGSTSFDDGVNEVSGAFVLGRPPSSEVGMLVYILVDNVAATVDKVVAEGGEIVQAIGADAPEITARFRDPAGNVLGLYQHPA